MTDFTKMSAFGEPIAQLATQCRIKPTDSTQLLNLRAFALGKILYQDLSPEIQVQGFSPKIFQHFQTTLDLSNPVHISEFVISKMDSSVKFLVGLRDGSLVESLLIPERGRYTLCISSQVGCAQACRFCQTGTMGLKRNLSSAEIIGQIVLVNQWMSQNNKAQVGQQVRSTHEDGSKVPHKISNIVFMGMGEPLDNVIEVLKACELLVHPHAFGLSPHKITVSTVGVLSRLNYFLTTSSVSLALSVHSALPLERLKIIPAEKDSPIFEIVSLIKTLTPKKTIFIQYTLIRGINDSFEHAAALAKLLSGLNCKINLIPLNEHSLTAFRRPDLSSVSLFQTFLKKMGFVVTIRLSKGRDIEGACGQLVVSKRTSRLDTSISQV